MGSKGIFSTIWRNFKQSFTIIRATDVYIGTDNAGNRYFERVGDETRGIKRQRRVEAKNTDPTVIPELPVEWMTWLQGRRADPPSEEEIARNIYTSQKILSKVRELEDNDCVSPKQASPQTSQSKFPVYPDYERIPGQSTETSEEKR